MSVQICHLEKESKELFVEKVKKWLSRGDVEFRRAVLEIILELKNFSAEEVAEELWNRGFDVSLKSVRSMIGLFPISLGILVAKGPTGKRRFELKEECVDALKSVLR